MKALKRIYLGLILLFLYAPITVMIVFSFNNSRLRVWGGFSLEWYVELFTDFEIMNALRNTLLVACIASVVATVIGTAASFGIHAMRRGMRRLVLNITNLPVLNPDIVTGLSLMILYSFVIAMLRNLGVEVGMGFTTLLLSHITFNIPYVILSVLPKIRQLDNRLYEAALDLGATPGYAFRKVILPEVMPGIVTGAIFAFTLSLDDFIISFFTTGPGGDTLSTIIYSYAKRGISPKINALSAIMFVIVMLLLFFVNRKDSSNLSS